VRCNEHSKELLSIPSSVFNIFMELIIKLSHPEASRDDSLSQKTISIGNVTMTSRFTTFESVISDKLILLRVIPLGKKFSSKYSF
jgi:hypothetical protein